MKARSGFEKSHPPVPLCGEKEPLFSGACIGSHSIHVLEK